MNRRLSRRLLTFLALALLLTALVLILRPIDTRYQDLLRQGDVLAARTERTAAAGVYEEASRLRPDAPGPYLHLAQLYLDWGRTDEALTALEKAERLGVGQGDSVRLAQLWIEVYVARADWPVVIERTQQLLALVSDDTSAAVDASTTTDVRHTLARAHVELRQWDTARAEYETLLQSDPNDTLAHERLGALLVGSDAAAIQHLYAAETDLSIELLAVLERPDALDNPAYVQALLGRVLFEAREWALASNHFEQALQFDPAYPDAHAYLGYSLDQMGYPREAWPHLLMAVSWAPDSAVTHIFLGMHYDSQGDSVAARVEYEAAYDLDPTNPATCISIGKTWADEGRYVAAEIWFLAAVSLQPEDPTLWEILVRFYLDHTITFAGQAVAVADKLLELAPDDAQAYDLRGWAAFQVGDYVTAQDFLLQALDLDPALASAHYHFGMLLSVQGDSQGAREAFVRAIDLDTAGTFVPLVERAMSGIP
ncbi:MAG: tetratricopeptide repeat protein [Anaerolineae bacterium]